MENTSTEFVELVMAAQPWIKSLIESIYDGVLSVDTAGQVSYVNQSYLKITGLNESDIVGHPLAKVRPGSVLSQVTKSGEARMGVYRREGNSEYVVDMAPIRHRGQIVGGISTVKEIARIQALSKELEKYVKKNQELASVVSHIYHARYTFQDIVGASPEIRKAVAFAEKNCPMRRRCVDLRRKRHRQGNVRPGHS